MRAAVALRASIGVGCRRVGTDQAMTGASNQTKNCVRIAVSFMLRAHIYWLVPPGSLAGVLRAGPGRGLGRRPPMYTASAARPAGRVGVGLPGLVTSAVTGSMAASRLRSSPCSLVIEVILEPGRTPHPAFPQSIFLCSYFVATTERFYAEGPTEDPTRQPIGQYRSYASDVTVRW